MRKECARQPVREVEEVTMRFQCLVVHRAALAMRHCILITLMTLSLGCVTSSQELRKVSIGMTKDDVIGVLDEPTTSRGALRNKYGQVIEVWEYRLAVPSDDSTGQVVSKSVVTLVTAGYGAKDFVGDRKNYWLYFLNDELVQFGEAGRWADERDRIYEFNFLPAEMVEKSFETLERGLGDNE